MNTIYQIRELACAYNKGKTVLRIPHLDIPQGELVFLLGVSGSGKSTLLETLALMNNTLASGEVHFSSNNNSFKFSELWQKNDAEAIAQVRKKHFSFIFQDTNLMENFTAYENICLAQMIKQDVRQEEAMTGAKQLANQVGLSSGELNADTLAVNLSGGQRQRLAFVRAINNDFSVIFGDEPTGNLDEANANELLRILKQNLKGTSSAVVVSHDIDLAVQHADRIVVITKSPKGYGEILPENIFPAQSWRDTPDAFRQQLADLYQAPAAPPGTQQAASDTSTNPTYTSLFFKKEGKALTGKRRINFWILTTMLTLTFMAIGFANGSLDYLNKKMNNAFVKWMSITVPWSEGDNAENIRRKLSNDTALADKFSYENVSAYVQYPLRFWNTTDNINTERVKGRSVRFDDNNGNPLVSELLRGKNLLHGDTAMSGNADLSLIVTRRFLNRLGMSSDAAFVNMEFTVNDTTSIDPIDLRVPIPVRAIVEEIPGRNFIIYTLNFYETHGEKVEGTFDIRLHRDIHLFVPGSRENAEKTLTAIDQFFKANTQYKGEEPDYRITGEHTMSHAEGYDIEITFYTILRGAETDKIWSKIQSFPQFVDASNDVKRIYHYDAARLRDDTNYDRISLYFNDLSKIRPFADALYRAPSSMGARNPIEVDIAQIKEKENFNFLSKITKIIAWLLVGFGATSISLFLFNLLKMHLSKVKMNIGTLKAFGLGNGEAQRIYFRIILRFLVWSLFLSLLIAALSGYVADLMLADRIVGESEASYFNLIHPNTLITLIILIIVTIFVSLYTIRTMLSKSPGDLIYNR